MSGMDASNFHKIRSLEDALGSIIKGEAPRRTRLPLQQVLIPALEEMLQKTRLKGADPRPALGAFSTDLEQWQKFLSYLQDTANRWYIFQSREWTFSSGWWQEQFSELHSAFEADPQQGVRQWVQTFTQALVEWDLEGCKTLAEQSFPFPDYLAYLPLMFEGGVEALIQGNLAEAEDMLAFLVQPGGIDPGGDDPGGMNTDRPTLEPVLHALVLVLEGRLEAQKEDPQGVEEIFKQAAELAPQDGRPQAALGEHLRLAEDHDQAIALFKEAIRLSPDQPEGYTGMAMVMEDQGYWEEAGAWYRQAVDCALRFPDPYRTLTRLLAPLTGNLYYHLGHALQDISERWALPAIDAALELGMRGALEYPEVDAYALQGKLLSKLRKKPQAALAYYEAGRRCGWNLDYEQAVKLLRKARKLDPNYQSTCWYLSDDLRLLSIASPEQPQKDKLIKESLQVWQEGLALGAITPEDAWALFTRALSNELLPERRTAPAEEVVLFDWEAVFFTERNLLMSDDKAYQWTYLARFYRSLNLDANNQFVLDRAWELDPSDNSAREEKIIRLTNRGDYPEAEELLKPLLEDESYPDINWARSVHGYILSRLGNYEDALQESEYNLKESWVQSYRTLCFLKLSQYPQAQEIFENMWEWRQAEDAGNLMYYAIAGLHLHLLDPRFADAIDPAIEYARRVQKSPSDTFESYAYLGFALLVKGVDLPEAQRILQEAVGRANNKRELNDCILGDIPILQKLMDPLPHGAQAISILEEVSRKMQAQVEVVEGSRLTPQAELLNQLEWLEGSQHAGMPAELVTNARLGARVSLARLYLNTGHWGEAAQAYHALLAYEALIPEARLGLDKALQNMQQTAETHLQQDEFQAALPLLEQRAEFAQHLGQEQDLPDIHCMLFYAHLSLSSEQPETSLPQAAALFEQAASLFQAQGREDTWLAISDCLRKSLRSVPDYWRVDEALGILLEQAVETGSQSVAGLQAVRQSLDDYLGEIYRLNVTYTGNPVANRIAIALGSNLLPPGPSQDWDLLLRIDLIRRDLYQDYGVVIPGVHIRLEPDSLAPDEYCILIDGQQVALERSLFKLNSNLQAVKDPGYYPVANHLKTAITYNLDRFMSLQAVSLLLADWQKISATHFLAASRLLQDNASLLAFQQVLLELVRDRVPVNKPAEILTTFLEIPLSDTSLPGIAIRLRIALRPYLPGNTPSANRILLPTDLENELSGYVQAHNGQAYLLLPDPDQDRLVARIKDLLVQPSTADEQADEADSRFGRSVLVCQDASLRPLLSRLIAPHLPQVAVLAAQEVLTEFPPSAEPSSEEATAAESSSGPAGDEPPAE